MHRLQRTGFTFFPGLWPHDTPSIETLQEWVTHLPKYLQDFSRFAYLCAWRKGQIASLTWADVDRNDGVIIARAENVKNGRAHKIVLEAELAEIIERRWAAREYRTKNNADGISLYVFHHNGRKVGDPRKAW